MLPIKTRKSYLGQAEYIQNIFVIFQIKEYIAENERNDD